VHETDTGTGGAGKSIVTIKVSLPAAPCMLPAEEERYALFLFHV